MPDHPQSCVIDKVAKQVAEYGKPFETELILRLNNQTWQNEVLESLFVLGNQKLMEYYTWRVYAYTHYQSKVWSMKPF